MNKADFELAHKIAAVTGAGNGIGAGIAKGYAQAGAAVAVIDWDLAAAQRVADEICTDGGKACALRCDVSDHVMVEQVVREITDKFGPIDVLVNNAGIGMRAPAEEMTEEQWDKVLCVNLKSAYNFCTTVGKQMIARGRGGRIINMASITCMVGVETGNINYAASKGGIVAMSRCLAIEWAKYNILVNVIAPTHVRTPLINRLIEEHPEKGEYFLHNIPLGRLGEVDDVVGPAVFLASGAARFITGHTLLVDGGHTAW
ncbi:SDR family NAD(P)-dependent oxidoreductase [Christensenella tenuis]|uniref:SDR family oxidoreductase n=1 Tax=Christensenella tenuis TaxID=2763033 RepID=A0ABR7EGA1_9FIRM|nr:SDR family NAD(P)-dependent oxidoreductase [Christensenella tenuis]MBC5648800.1 SDR family oxidoreductase [Christensenella tenuis]